MSKDSFGLPSGLAPKKQRKPAADEWVPPTTLRSWLQHYTQCVTAYDAIIDDVSATASSKARAIKDKSTLFDKIRELQLQIKEEGEQGANLDQLVVDSPAKALAEVRKRIEVLQKLETRLVATIEGSPTLEAAGFVEPETSSDESESQGVVFED